MNKFLKATIISSLLLSSIYANEEKKENLFLGVDFSISNDVAKSVCKEDEDKTLFGSLKVGYNLDIKPIRFYISYTPIKWKYAKADLIGISVDYLKPLNEKFDLFLGASVGDTKLEGDFSGKKSKTNFGFQSGFIFKLSKKFNLEVAYKFINANDIIAKNNQNYLSLENFNIFNLGVNFNF